MWDFYPYVANHQGKGICQPSQLLQESFFSIFSLPLPRQEIKKMTGCHPLLLKSFFFNLFKYLDDAGNTCLQKK